MTDAPTLTVHLRTFSRAAVQTVFMAPCVQLTAWFPHLPCDVVRECAAEVLETLWPH